MAEKLAEKTKEEITLESLKKQIDGLCAEVRRHSANWVRFSEKHVGAGGGTKVGEVN